MQKDQKEWRGYTLDEIRVHRLVNITKIELEKTRLSHKTEGYTNGAGALTPSPIINKLLGALDYFDYGVLAYRLGKKLFAIFKHRK